MPFSPRLDGARTAAKMGLLLALIGPVAQTVITSGLGPSVSNALVLSPVGQVHAIAPPLVMLATLICGAVIPEAATYIIMALALAPFLEELGYSRVASHMFVFYYSIFATIIPPVAITAMTAAQLAGAPFMETSVRAMKLAFIGLFVPYVFIFNTTLLEFPRTSVAQLVSLAACVLGMVGLSAAWWGWLFRPLGRSGRGVVALAGIAFLIWAAFPP
ncbi:MAG: TRAP transporter large permease subunit [Geminicoccales bacterium]